MKCRFYHALLFVSLPAAYNAQSNTDSYSDSASPNSIIHPPTSKFILISKEKVFLLININLPSVPNFSTDEWSKAGLPSGIILKEFNVKWIDCEYSRLGRERKEIPEVRTRSNHRRAPRRRQYVCVCVCVCVSKNGDIWGRASIFEWTWNLETVESELLTGQSVALIPTD